MAVKTAGKRYQTELEKDVRIAMIQHGVDQVDVAEYENVTAQAINNRLARLTHKKAQDFKELILEVKAWKLKQTPQKATG